MFLSPTKGKIYFSSYFHQIFFNGPLKDVTNFAYDDCFYNCSDADNCFEDEPLSNILEVVKADPLENDNSFRQLGSETTAWAESEDETVSDNSDEDGEEEEDKVFSDNLRELCKVECSLCSLHVLADSTSSHIRLLHSQEEDHPVFTPVNMTYHRWAFFTGYFF